MSITYRMEVDQDLLDDMPGNGVTMMLDQITNNLRGYNEDTFDMKYGDYRVYLEREGETIWTIYRIEKDANTIKV